MSPLPLAHILASLPTSSNQVKVLHKEAVPSAREHTESRVLLLAATSDDYPAVHVVTWRVGRGLLTA